MANSSAPQIAPDKPPAYSAKLVCLTRNCTRAQYARGLCQNCYQKWRRTTKRILNGNAKQILDGKSRDDGIVNKATVADVSGAEYQRILKETQKPDYGMIVADALDRFASEHAVITTGDKAGNQVDMPEYFLQFVEAAYSAKESALSVSRKNCKSSGISLWLGLMVLGDEDDPPRLPGWRGICAGLDGATARETLDLFLNLTANSAKLRERMTYKGFPSPGAILGPNGRQARWLNASSTKGAAIGTDLVILEEAGLFPERLRPMAQLLYSSTSNRRGKYVMVGTRYDGQIFQELIERADEPNVHVSVHSGPSDLDITDAKKVNKAIKKANPCLGTAKPIDEVLISYDRALKNPANLPAFLADEINAPNSSIERKMLIQLPEWNAVTVRTTADLPPPDGPSFLGVDAGAARSMTSCAMFWPQTGRLVVKGAFPDAMSLAEREKADFVVPGMYVSMMKFGELELFPGAVTPVTEFVKSFIDENGPPDFIGSDRYRKAEVQETVRKLKLRTSSPKWCWRGMGAGAKADGSADVRAFQKAVYDRKLRALNGPLMKHALAHTELRFDGAGNPALKQIRRADRIDACQAAVIAVGLAAVWMRKHPDGVVSRKGEEHVETFNPKP